MRKIIVLALALGLGACASVTNPITTTRLAQIESGYGIALSAAVAYRDACNKRVISRATCTPVVKKLRIADQQAQAALAVARVAAGAGDTINAVSALTAAQNALSAFQAIEAQYGVK